MMTPRSSLSIALGLCLGFAAPLACAQSTTTDADAAANAAAAAGLGPQQAPPVQDGPKVTWAQLDADGDGALSSDEAAGIEGLGDAFDEADADDDGLLTAEEYRDWYQTQPTAADAADTDDAATDDAGAAEAPPVEDAEDTDDGSSTRDPAGVES